MLLRRLSNRIRAPFELLYWRLTTPKMGGAKLLIRYQDTYLLIKEVYGPKHWTLPGGRSKRNEDSEAAARRKARQEVGIALARLVPLGSYFHTRQHKKDVVCAFYAEVDSPEHRANRNVIGESGWFTLDEIRDLDKSESVDDVLDLYRKQDTHG